MIKHLVILSVLFTSVVQAQPTAQNIENPLFNELGLSEQQRVGWILISQTIHPETNEILKDPNLTETQKGEKIGKLRYSLHPKLEALLTPEQLQKLKDIQEEKPNTMLGKLQLSPEQEKKIAPLMDELERRISEIKADTNTDQNTKIQSIKALKKQYKQQFINTLNSEQRVLWSQSTQPVKKSE